MRLARLVGPFVFFAGIASLAEGFFTGQATLNLFVIFPVVSATGPWAILGIVLMIVGVFLYFLTGSTPFQPLPSAGPASDSPSPQQPLPETRARRWGGVVFLGPVPVVFGSDQKVTQWMLLVGVALFVALLVLTVIALWGI